jgi:spore maturation protein CgeB
MNKPLKILVIGEYIVDFHEEAFCVEFEKSGYEVIRFKTKNYFTKWSSNILNNIQYLFQRLSLKVQYGYSINKMNEDVRKLIDKSEVDLVFIYRGLLIYSDTVKLLSHKAPVFIYNNDDPFSKKYPPFFWRHYLGSLPFAKTIFYYRTKNEEDYKKLGYNNISLLKPYYMAHKNFYIPEKEVNQYTCDVIFIGHYENDGRDILLKKVIDSGVNIKLFGPEWQKSPLYTYFVNKMGEIKPISKDYNLAINSAKIALVFLSKINNDTYTRRCFEIPPTKTFMLCEYSNDMNNIFKMGYEADYFNSVDEILEKIEYYLKHPIERQLIADRAYQRLIQDGHEISHRAKQVVQEFSSLKDEVHISN